MKKILTKILLLMSLSIILFACSKPENNSSNKIKVVTSVNFYAEIAKNIAGDNIEIHSIIDSTNVDPHDFEPTPEDAKKVSEADIVIFNGGGYDSWFEKLANNSKNIIKINAAELINLKNGENEHIWYNPEVLKNVSEQFTKEIIKKDNSKSDEYMQNKEKYNLELKKIYDKIETLKNKTSNKFVITTEPVFDYVISELNLLTTDETKRLAKSVAEGNDPSPQDLKKIQEDIKSKKISFIINNVQTINKTVESIILLAEENNIPILNVYETKPENTTYVDWMISQYDNLEKIIDTGVGEKAFHLDSATESHEHNHDHNH